MENSYTEVVEVFMGTIKKKTNNGIEVAPFSSNPFSNEPTKTRTFSHSLVNYSNFNVDDVVVITTYKTIKPDPESDPIHPTTISTTSTVIETNAQYAQRMLEEKAKAARIHAAKAMPSIYQKEEQ